MNTVNHGNLIRVPCPVCDTTQATPERIVNGFALERCGGCGHVFMNPQVTTDSIDEMYTDRDDEALKDLYARIDAAPSVRQQYRQRLDRIEGLTRGRGRVLDFACGAGGFMGAAQERGWEAHGVELGAWAGQAAAARGLKNFHVGELTALQFPSHHFDAIHAANVFEHLAKPKIVLAEMLRILTPGGLLYIEVPNYHTIPILLNRDDFMLNEPPQHVNYFTPKTLAHLLRSAGFNEVHTRTGGGLKWENLIGKSLKSEIKDAYGLGESKPRPSSPASVPASPGIAGRAKEALLKSFVKPILYDRLKVGMGVVAEARPERQ